MNPDDTLAAIDDVLTDWRGSADSARWHASGGPDLLRDEWAISPADPGLAIMFEDISRLAAAIQVQFAQMSGAFARMTAALAPLVTAASHDFVVARLTAGDRRRHRGHCATCNPYGNPRPLAISGHEYHRRLRARQRRRR